MAASKKSGGLNDTIRAVLKSKGMSGPTRKTSSATPAPAKSKGSNMAHLKAAPKGEVARNSQERRERAEIGKQYKKNTKIMTPEEMGRTTLGVGNSPAQNLVAAKQWNASTRSNAAKANVKTMNARKKVRET